MITDQWRAVRDTATWQQSSRQLWGGFLILLSSLCFGGVVVLGKLALHDKLPVLPVLGIRYTVSAVALLAIGAFSGQRLILPRRDCARLIMLGMTGDALSAWLFFAALTLGSVAVVSILFFTYPILVMLLSPRRTRSRPVILGLVAAVTGVSVMLGAGHALAISGLGVQLTLAAALVYAGFLLGADRAVRNVNPLASSFWLSAGTAAGIWFCAGISRTAVLPEQVGQWVTVTAMGIATAASVIFFIVGLGLLGALRASILGGSEPLATTGLAIAFLHERLSLTVAIGGALVVFGGAAAMLSRTAPATRPVVKRAGGTDDCHLRDQDRNDAEPASGDIGDRA
jgi:drug/metabolite transporter (DMT)-like permease